MAAADARAHLEDGGILHVPTDEGLVAVCLVAAGPASGALRARGPVAVAFASWLEARLFVDASDRASALAASLLPGPLGLVCATSGFGLEEFERPAGGLDVRVPADGQLHALLEEMGPLVVQAVEDGDPATSLAGLPTLRMEGRVGAASPTVVDSRGATPVVLLEGVIKAQAVRDAWGPS